MAEAFHFLTLGAAPTSGVRQVESTPIVGSITGSGNATVTVTAAGMTNSPKAVSVPVLNGDTTTQSAAKMADALNADPDVGALFVASSSGASLILTARRSAANDATLNIAYTNGTCTGLTPDATSDNTTAGVLGTYRGVRGGVYLADTTNGNLYVNTGTNMCPVWTAA
jgi:phage tail sheath gpL-like